MGSIKILIADSQVLIREGLRAILKGDKNLEILDEAENSSQLFSSLKKYSPHVLIIDYAFPGNFAIDDIGKIRSAYPDTGILAITNDPLKDDLFRALEYGVNSFLLKQCDRNEIMSAVHATAKHEKFFCGKVLDIILDKQMHDKSAPCEPTCLTKRETEIVGLIAMGATTKSIASDLHLSAHTVTTHRKNILKKLKVNTTAELVLYAINTSIIQTPTYQNSIQNNS